MIFRRIWYPAVAIGLIPILLTLTSGPKESESSIRTGEDTHVQKVRGPIVGTSLMFDFDEQFYAEEQRQIETYLAAVEAERLAVKAYLDSVYQESLRTYTPRSSSVVVTGDCAGVAAIVGNGTVMRESGGNPAAENGIYKGCAQIGLPWWNGACSGLSWTNVDDQVKCTQIVMDIQGPSAWAGTYGG